MCGQVVQFTGPEYLLRKMSALRDCKERLLHKSLMIMPVATSYYEAGWGRRGRDASYSSCPTAVCCHVSAASCRESTAALPAV